MAPGRRGLHRQRVQALVALARCLEVLARARELRRVDDHQIERARRGGLEVATGVGLHRFDGDAVLGRVAERAGDAARAELSTAVTVAAPPRAAASENPPA